MERLRCFVAMAMGRDDTNRVYDNLIAPTLRKQCITPIFLGRLEHNDDIDKRIIKELQECDLAVADLTYARPSVYFEAGFAQRKVEVIYTCRRDHSPRDRTQLGNFRVHFDLQMKNIIWWSGPRDRVFAKKLRTRISRLTAPLRLARQKEKEKAERREVENFKALSVEDRAARIARNCVGQLSHAGYRAACGAGNLCWGTRYVKNTLESVEVQIFSNLTETAVKKAADTHWGLEKQIRDSVDLLRSRRVKRVIDHLAFCSLRKVLRQRIGLAFPGRYNRSVNGYMVKDMMHVPGAHKRLPVQTYIHVIDGIESESSFGREFSEMLARIKILQPHLRRDLDEATRSRLSSFDVEEKLLL